jgi:hypothetical protein
MSSTPLPAATVRFEGPHKRPSPTSVVLCVLSLLALVIVAFNVAPSSAPAAHPIPAHRPTPPPPPPRLSATVNGKQYACTVPTAKPTVKPKR